MFKPTSYYDASFTEEKFDELMLATADQDGLMSKEDKIKLDELVATEAPTVDKDTIGLSNVTNDAQVKRSEMGVAGGVATLDESGVIPSSQLPSYVDDVIEGTLDTFPVQGESGKIYLDPDKGVSYRWSGTQYVEIPKGGVALGETSATAYAGDKGKANAEAIDAIVTGATVVPKAVDAATINGLTVGVAVPANAVFTDTVYEHPETHEAGMIIESEDKRFVTDEQIAKWDAKADVLINFPYYDETDNCVYACGVGIVIEAAEEDGKIKIKWADVEGNKEITVPEGINIYGGGDGVDIPVYYPATAITMNSGLVKYVYGGNRRGSVGNAVIIVNGGSFVEGNGGIIAGGHSAGTRESVVGHAEITINNTDNEATLVYAGGQGLAVVGYTRLVMNGGSVNYLTAGGSNGYTGTAEVVINGGTIKVLQGCNRGFISNIKTTVNGGTVNKLYAGGETEDKSVDATYNKAELYINGGAISAITSGTNGGVESAENVSGEYVEGVITEEVAAALNLVKAPIKFTDVVFENGTLVFKNGETVVKSVTMA